MVVVSFLVQTFSIKKQTPYNTGLDNMSFTFCHFFVSVCVCDHQAKVEAAHDALMEVTRCNTELLARKKKLVEENMELKRKLETRQRKTVKFFHSSFTHTP